MNLLKLHVDHGSKESRDERVPGTETLLDQADESQRILVPQPSDDPRDPLNWSTFWKAMTTVSVTFMSFAQGFGPLAIAPMFPELAKEFDSDLSSVVQFTGVSILVLGFSNFFWIPLSSNFGRRPALLASTLVSLVSSIWKAKATTYRSFMGACVLNGIGSGPGETLQPQIITDYVFLHDRGKYNTLYFASYFGSLNLSPVVAALLAQHGSWRNFWWLNVGLLGLSLVISIIAFPETRWQRSPKLDGRNPSKDTDMKIDETTETKAIASSVEPRTPSPGDEEKMKTGTLQGQPRKTQFHLFTIAPDPIRGLLRDFLAPFQLLAYPIVLFAAFIVSWSASSFLMVNLTQAQAFSEEPYKFSAQKIGFFNLAVVAGQLIGMATAGPIIDRISMWFTKRNHGVREAEMRLPAMVPFLLIMMLGNFIVGFGYDNHWNWKAIVIVGYSCAGIQVAALPAIASTYAIDSYKPATGSIFVTITVVKNLWGYGLSKFVTEWSEADGFLAPIMTNMSLTILWCLFGVLFWWKGKKLRYWTRHSKLHEGV